VLVDVTIGVAIVVMMIIADDDRGLAARAALLTAEVAFPDPMTACGQ
jgi:hypothetical protein